MRTLLIGLAALTTGCGLSCNDMWAPSSTYLEVIGGDGSAGRYQLELSGYGQVAMCVVDLPADDDELISCTSNAMLTLSEDGTAIVGMLATSFAPDNFEATLFIDGERIADDHYAPDYAVDEPNGKNCGERKTADVTLAL